MKNVKLNTVGLFSLFIFLTSCQSEEFVMSETDRNPLSTQIRSLSLHDTLNEVVEVEDTEEMKAMREFLKEHKAENLRNLYDYTLSK